MCLDATQEKLLGDPAPERTRAWKIVGPDREPFFQTQKSERYFDGAVVAVDRECILAARRVCDCFTCRAKKRPISAYNDGLHVYTMLPPHKADEWTVVIEVEVSPEDWVADDVKVNEAVYCKLRVIGESKGN